MNKKAEVALAEFVQVVLENEIAYWKEESERLSKRVTELEDLLFKRGEMFNPPCFVCGYNGPDYYQPDKHPCAKRHHDSVFEGAENE